MGPTVLYNLLLALLFPLALRIAAPLDLRGKTAVLLGGFLLAELAVLVSPLARLQHAGRSLADLVWGRPAPKRPIVAGILVAMLYSAMTLASPIFGGHATELSWIILTFVLGTVLAALYLAGRRSLTPVGLTHALIHVLIEPWLILGTVRLPTARVAPVLTGKESPAP
ncbi:hypothetical protein U7230_15225 [Carboxydochorda subterranea]|uniref:CPBP family intramembrane metalloprotease n=1 Tax=Carboxydichorda subterranea TaxID=3109565 RepID=A0ABZ1BX75_9FIRM|nr:hypothetical protein [Limnochorda sp. L945t]WRP17410.1 hypothetical protein U7230_15225 [Limnochorda sp. L945t]